MPLVGGPSTPTRAGAVAIIASALLGCGDVRDRCHGSDVCGVHGTRMRPVVIREADVLVQWTPAYLSAMEAGFPNAAAPFPEHWQGDGRIRLYRCSACFVARARWQEAAR